ncbi:MAG: HEAT repeat domain-containing protein, partial [Pirellulales bacterium]|nr:HEAT repeat domain-containing protein [Pirellulales bacterium]
RFVLESLERSVERYRQHQRQELIEAFVVLGGPANPLLRRILEDPRHACYQRVINTLTHSNVSGVLELLISSLNCDYTATSLLNVISKRTDKEFMTRFVKIGRAKPSAEVLKNLERIRSFAWLQPGNEGFHTLDEEDKAGAIGLAAASGIEHEELLHLLEKVLKQGGPVSRLAACEALVSISGAEADQLILGSVHDEDPRVQAACVRQLRNRHLVGTMAMLLKTADSPHEIVREATQEALQHCSSREVQEVLKDAAGKSLNILGRPNQTGAMHPVEGNE